jgi:hypothetical protein
MIRVVMCKIEKKDVHEKRMIADTHASTQGVDIGNYAVSSSGNIDGVDPKEYPVTSPQNS